MRSVLCSSILDSRRAGAPLTVTLLTVEVFVTVVSTIVFQAWHSGHRPSHLGLSFPHCWHTKLVFTLSALAIISHFLFQPSLRAPETPEAISSHLFPCCHSKAIPITPKHLSGAAKKSQIPSTNHIQGLVIDKLVIVW
jgi:hypothetical protein